MAHGMTETDRFAYVKQEAWHGLGIKLEGDGALSSVMADAAFPWRAITTPVYIPNDVGFKVVPNRIAVVRDDTREVLGIQSDTYEVYQYFEYFEFGDNIVQDGIARWETAGTLQGGKRGFALMQMQEGWRVGDDEYCPFLFFHSSHDGTHSVTVKTETIRVVCQNTADAALLSGSGNFLVRLKHNANLRANLDAAQETIKVTTEDQRRMQEFLQSALATEMKKDVRDAITAEIFGRPDDAKTDKMQTRIRNKVGAFRRIGAEEYSHYGDTAYTMIQAITGFADHWFQPNNRGTDEQRAERRTLSVIEGKAYKFKSDALGLVREVIGV
jgi:phage/plasmid-like protein (TIGR03299 family)